VGLGGDEIDREVSNLVRDLGDSGVGKASWRGKLAGGWLGRGVPLGHACELEDFYSVRVLLIGDGHTYPFDCWSILGLSMRPYHCTLEERPYHCTLEE
jgi:hypothetical protein